VALLAVSVCLAFEFKMLMLEHSSRAAFGRW